MSEEFKDKMQEFLDGFVVDIEKAAQENLDNMTKYVDGYAVLAVAAQSEADILNRMHNPEAATMVETEASLYRELSALIDMSQKKLKATPFLESPIVAYELLEQEHLLLEKLMLNRNKMLEQARRLKEMLSAMPQKPPLAS